MYDSPAALFVPFPTSRAYINYSISDVELEHTKNGGGNPFLVNLRLSKIGYIYLGIDSVKG